MMYKIKTDNDDIKELISLACRIGNINKTDLLSSSRKGKVSEIRACVAVVLRMAFNLTQVDTGKILGRDHSTIQFYENEHRKMMSRNYYKVIYNDLILFAKQSGHDFYKETGNSNAVILSLRQEIAALKFKNKELNKKFLQK